MKSPVETIRLSQRSRDTLIKLKRRTGIEHWNVFCRWAFCSSLANLSKPVSAPSPESNIEMSWKIFSGSLSDVYIAALMLRAKQDGISYDKESIANYFRHHLERGIQQLTNTRDLLELLKEETEE